jgi:DNA-binding protein HU-beta
MSINKPELVVCIAKKGNISKVEAKKALELTIEAISEALAKGEDVTLIGFGTFKVTELAERTGRNPQTGKAMQIKPKKVVRFKAGNELASKVK